MKSLPSLPRCLWLLVLCALAVAGCDSTQSDPVVSMDNFFAQLRKQNYEGAYNSASLSFQVQQSKAAFEAIVRDLKLDESVSTNWTKDSASSGEARLKGEFLGKNDKSFALNAVVIKESGRWKLFSLSTPSPRDPSKMLDVFSRFGHGVGFNELFTRKLPDENEIRGLVSETMQQFNEGLHRKNFDAFFQYTSEARQAQSTPEQIARIFKPFVDKGITIDYIKDSKAIFDEEPRYDSEGHMKVKGYYPTQPNRVLFDLTYVYELPKWKLLSVMLNVTQ